MLEDDGGQQVGGDVKGHLLFLRLLQQAIQHELDTRTASESLAEQKRDYTNVRARYPGK